MNQPGKKTRRLLALLTFIVASLFLVFVFFATRNALDVWERMQSVPKPLFYTYTALIILFIMGSFWLIYKILRPQAPRAPHSDTPLNEEQLNTQLEQAENFGINTEGLQQELIELNARKASGRIYVALFGDVSTGKSSIVKALLPDAKVDISVRAGSTQEIKQYLWRSSAGDELVLSDLPGQNEAGGELESLIEEEARRAQLVIYVCESDLSRSQLEDVLHLLNYNKPLILCINKSDRLSNTDRKLIEKSLRIRLKQSEHITLAFVQSGGKEEVIQIGTDGEERSRTRPRIPDVDALAFAIQEQIDVQSEQLNLLRDASVFVLIKQKLDEATLAHRQQEGEKIIKSSTRKAIFGALASLSPGSDLIIQGIVGTAMVKQLCKLYDTPVKTLDIDQFFDFSQGQIKKTVPLLLAVAGNAMKAFPGVGTVSGALTHAFAYGLIFDALGHAVHKTLRQRGALKPIPAAISFGDYLNQNMQGQNLPGRATELAKLVFEANRYKEKQTHD